MAQFETSLRQAWSPEMPAIPAHLKNYQEAWLETFAAAPVEATGEEFLRAVRLAPVLLVSDFHASERSRRGLATLLAALPLDQPVNLVLELLPLGTTLTAQLAIAGGSPPLVTGEPLEEAYGPALQLLAERRGTIIGAWSDGSIQHRDRVASDLLQRLRQPHRAVKTIFHGGDWHLAESHLPKLLQQLDLEPTVVHQSPEPLWQVRGIHQGAEHLKLPIPGHWAWMETPPLHLWAALLQDMRQGDEEDLQEAMSHLVGAAAQCFADLLGLEGPGMELTLFPRRRWHEFHQQLPTIWQEALSADHPPKRDIFHPRRPWLWTPRSADLNLLTRAAAHLILCDQGVVKEVSLQAELRRSAFRHAAARVANPFLCKLEARTEAEALFSGTDQALVCAIALKSLRPEQLDCEALNPALEVLATRIWGSHIGHGILAQRNAGPADLRNLLFGAGEGFDWRALTATILAAS